MKQLLLTIIVLLLQIFSFAQTDPATQTGYGPVDTSATILEDTLAARVVLIGDAGALVGGKQPVIDAVRRLIPLDNKTSVVYLGDNFYRVGLPDEQSQYYLEMRAALDTQVNLVNNTPAKGYFIPGNHDWDNGGVGGYAAVLRQQRYIDQISKESIHFFPMDGCPGPVSV